MGGKETVKRYDVVIVGGGHGGAAAAIVLRQAGFAGTVAILSREADAPYERPPLSKDYLSGDKTFDRIYIRPPSFWGERGIDLHLRTEVVSVDPGARVVTTAGGDRIGYGDLIWATGGTPRALPCPGADLAGVHNVRDRPHVDAIVAELPDVTRIAVIGGGYIGLEAAAVLRKLGKQIVLFEALPRVLARVAGAEISAFYEAEHRAQGVDLRTGAAVACLTGANGRVSGVELADGTHVAAQMAIVGIGIVPAVAPLRAAGATGSDGVDVDAVCRTSLPHVYAVGDCAAHRNDFAGGATIRVESVQNASDQAGVAARAICGDAQPYRATPWFWSNQYDLKLQTVGLSIGHDASVLRGDPGTRSFSVVYLRDGRVIALDCVNAIKDYTQGRRLVEARAVVTPDALADASRPLKEMLPV